MSGPGQCQEIMWDYSWKINCSQKGWGHGSDGRVFVYSKYKAHIQIPVTQQKKKKIEIELKYNDSKTSKKLICSAFTTSVLI